MENLKISFSLLFKREKIIVTKKILTIDYMNLCKILQIRADPKVDIKWYYESMEIDPNGDPRWSISRSGSKCCFTIENVEEKDSGRYVCEAGNSVGKVSSFARLLVVDDPKIIEADEKFKSRYK